MKKCVLIWFAAFALLVSGIGCANKKHQISIGGADYFEYSGVPWGSTPEEVKKALSVDFDGEVKDSNSRTIYFVDDCFTVNALKMTACFSFGEDGLDVVTFKYADEKDGMDGLLDYLYAELSGEFGEPTIPLENRQLYIWEKSSGKNSTRLQLSKTFGPESKIVPELILTVGLID